MSDPRRAQAEREIAAVNDALRQGHPARPKPGRTTERGAVRAAADALGENPRSLTPRVGAPESPGLWARLYGLVPGWALSSDAGEENPAGKCHPPDQFSAYEAVHAPRKLRIPIKAATQATPPEGPVYTIAAVGDAHDRPGRCKERFRWIGKFVAEHRPDYAVWIGDVANFDSLSTHEVPGSAADADRPSFHHELDSLDEALATYHEGVDVGAIPTFVTLGNHEHRAVRAANRQPKQCGDMPMRLEEVFARYRWQASQYGEMLTLAGVDFVHCCLNVMGREMGGEHVERNVAHKALRSIVFGHTHKANVINLTKVGQNRKITVVNLGTAMPYGTIEKYSGVAPTGWSYGVFLIRIQGGQILSCKHHDMLELGERYA